MTNRYTCLQMLQLVYTLPLPLAKIQNSLLSAINRDPCENTSTPAAAVCETSLLLRKKKCVS